MSPRAVLDRRVLGWAMSAFFGGRAEARIVRVPVPVVPVDATSMYSLVHALLGSWRVLTARGVRAVDATGPVRRLLARDDLLARCFERACWRRSIGVTLVELEAVAGSILPVRAPYDRYALDPGIGVNPFHYDGRLWYVLPDVIASVLLSGIVPRVRRAVRLVGVGRQAGLRPVRLRGRQLIDPLRDDPFVLMINARQRIRTDLTLPQQERDRLDVFHKITASATAYGSLARFDRRDERAEVLVYGPDERPLRKRVDAVEDPGPFTFPPVAAAITAGARLMLALLERLVADAGSAYLYCDTDAMGLLASPQGGDLACPTPDGSDRIRILSFDQVRAVLGRFSDLNPFDPRLVPCIWKVEHDAMARPLWGYAISAKRYALFRTDGDRRPDLVTVGEERDEGPDAQASDALDELTDWSEHGLGLYQSPLIDQRGKALRDEEGRVQWIREAWSYIVERVLGGDPPLPSWAHAFALTPFSVSNPAIAGWFRGRDQRVDPKERMRPGSFGLLAHPFLRGGPQPAAPFEPDPARWPHLEWYDRTSGTPIRAMAFDPSGPDRLADRLSLGCVPIRTLGDVLATYTTRPEHKSLAPDGSPASGTTVGLLRRRPVRSSPHLTQLSGKEGNKLLQRATREITDPGLYRSDYGPRVDAWELVAPVLREMGTRLLVQSSGKPERTVRRAMARRRAPRHAERGDWMFVAAVEHAREQLRGWSVEPLRDPIGLLQLYANEADRRGPRRCVCGCALPTQGRSKWASEACRKRTARRTSRLPHGAPLSVGRRTTAETGAGRLQLKRGDVGC